MHCQFVGIFTIWHIHTCWFLHESRVYIIIKMQLMLDGKMDGREWILSFRFVEHLSFRKPTKKKMGHVHKNQTFQIEVMKSLYVFFSI